MENIKNVPEHIAIIMDGNRRWAREHKMEIALGHKQGAKNLEDITLIANEIGIKYLTVYTFSTENWKRSETEVSAIMRLLKYYLDNFANKFNNENIRVMIAGDLSNINKELQDSFNSIIELTKNNTGLTLNIAFNYGGRAELIHAFKEIHKEVEEGILNIDDIEEKSINKYLYTAEQPDPDLIIRTGGELRLSNFLLWQMAYSELYFTKKYWPDFDKDDLLNAIEEFNNRQRRFGGK